MIPGIIGAQLYTVRDFLKTEADVQKSFRRLAKIGYTAVQVSGVDASITPAQIAKAAQEAGLEIAATHMNWKRLTEETDAVIAEHKLWKCTQTAVGMLPWEYYDAAGIARFADEAKPVSQKLADAGIDFSYHNHNQEFQKYNGRTWLERMYELTGPDIVKAEIDTYWVQAGGCDPVEWVARYPGRQPLLHLKDMAILRVEKVREQRFAEVGEGNLAWPAILKAAAKSGVKYYLVEQDNTYGKDPFDALELSLKNLRAMMQKY